MDGVVALEPANREVAWRPHPGPQTWLLTCPIEDILFGGARGGGKSDALLGDFLAHAALYGVNARGIILRRSVPSLEELLKRANEIFSAIGGDWRAGTQTWTMPNRASLKFRWLDRDQDADNYQGHQYTWIGIDEAGTWPSPDPIDKLRATLRSAAGVPCLMRLTANPGGVGHQWIKERYVTPSKPMVPFFDGERRTHRVFIPSKLQDNPSLMENDPGYMDRIKSSGPPWLVRAWLEGDWDASAGDSFFTLDILLHEGKPVAYPDKCDAVFVIIDTAVKTGSGNDGTSATFFCINKYIGTPLIILDWEVLQIEGALLDAWLPIVFQRAEELARMTKARRGSIGAFIEDKASGMVLIQQSKRRGLPVHAIDSKLTAVGKDERALSVSGYVYRNMVKISEHAYSKTVIYKGYSRNHFLSQVTGYRLGQKDQEDDAFDTFCYGVAIALGNSEGF